MKLMKRVTALFLCFLMLSSGLISAFAQTGVSGNDVVAETTAPAETAVSCEECGGSDAHTETCSFNILNTSASEGGSITLDFLPADLIAESERMTDTTAVINANPVTLYKSLDNGAEGIEVAVESGTVIDLITKYTFTISDTETLVFYRYDYYGTNEALNDAALSEYSGYVFIYSGDISIQGTEDSGDTETPVLTDKTDTATGVSISAELPADVELTVTSKTVAESGLDTTAYPINGASLFYDVTLYQNNAEYQPENGITVTFPESAITGSGLAVGDYYKIYHIHDGVTDVTGPFQYTGGSISADFANLSVVGIAEAGTPVDLVSLHGGTYTEESIDDLVMTINVDPVTLYDGFESSVYTAEVTGATGIEVEAYKKVTFADGFVLYQYAYYGDDTDFAAVANVYQFIAETDVTAAGEEPEQTEQTLNDVNGTGVTVTGTLPVGSHVQATATTTAPTAIISTDHLDFSVTITQFGYDITLYDSSNVEIQPDGAVTVYVPGAWDTSLSNPIVDVYHILDNADAITAAKLNGTLLTTTDAGMVAAYLEEAAVARNALGLAETDADVVAYVLLSSRSNTVELTEDGGIQFETDSFSDYYIVSGDTDASSIRENSTIYITPGMSGTFTIQNTDVTLTAGTVDEDVTVTKGSVSTGDRNQYTTFNVSAKDSASLGDMSTYSLSWGRRTITITVVVVDAAEYIKQQYLGNTVNHLQIDIDSTAVALGYNNDESFSLNLGFSDSTDYTLTKVEDDSQVGFYYALTYSYTDSSGAVIPVTITVRVDELATDLPDGITFEDVGENWFVNDNGVTSEDNQVSFGNSNNSTMAQFPVGTSENPIVYSVTVETTKELTPNDSTTGEDVDISVSNNISYWDAGNECPGKNTNTIGRQSGMDLGSFSTGFVLGDTTVYVVYSDLTKIVEGYTFGADGNLASRSYVFKLERSTDNGVTWTAIDTVTITVGSDGSATASVTADASKYCEDLSSVEEFESCLFRVSETGYNISGYTCEVVLKSIDSSRNRTELTDGKFTWSKKTSSDGKSVIFSVELECTNTYSEAGLSITKVVENAPASAVANDTFTVKVWPKELSTDGIEAGTNMYMLFNTGAYKVNGEVLSVTGNTLTESYGYITVTIKAGQTLTITGLPAGTYYVQEVDGGNVNYKYDLTQREVNLSSGNAAVTVTNTYKYADLTITKTGAENIDENQSFIFTVTGPNGFTMDVVINGNGSVTIQDLPIGDYTVTENTAWSWRYTPTDKEQTITLTANDDNTVNFSNSRSWIYWLSGDSYNENQFTLKSKDEEN